MCVSHDLRPMAISFSNQCHFKTNGLPCRFKGPTQDIFIYSLICLMAESIGNNWVKLLLYAKSLPHTHPRHCWMEGEKETNSPGSASSTLALITALSSAPSHRSL